MISFRALPCLRRSLQLRFLMAALAAGPVLSPLPAETLTVAAASSLASCLDDLHAAFTSAHPKITVQTTLGASGTLFAQITHGAPFDVFLSADMTYPAALIQSGLAEGPAPTAFAEGRIALWTLRDSLDLSSGLPALTKTRSIAIAQPEYAPYGIAARKALERAGLWDTLKPRIVYGENIAQTAHFVASGNADAGIVANSVLHTPAYTGKGNYKLLPSEGLVQGAVLTRRARDNPAATTYIEFLTSPAAQKIFIRFGFSLPD